MPVPEGCETSLKATPATAQGAEAAQSPAWQSLGTGWAQSIWPWGHLSSYVSPGPRMNVGVELEGSREEGSSRAQVGTEEGCGPAGHPAAMAGDRPARVLQAAVPACSASTFIPSQPSWLWGQRTLELEQAVTALSQAPRAPFQHGQVLRHHGTTGADPLHGLAF